MQKIRNAAIIIVLCVISGYKAYKPAAPRLNLLPGDGLHDALAGHRADPINTGLHLSNSDDDNLHDSVAGNAIPGFHNGPRGNTEDGTPPPPRGGGDGGVGSFSGPNPGSQIPPQTLSPSGPASPSTPPSPPK